MKKRAKKRVSRKDATGAKDKMSTAPHHDLMVLSGGAVQKGLETLAQAFQDATCYRLELAFATAPTLRRKIENKEVSPDVVVVPTQMMEEFERSGYVAVGSSSIIGSVKAGVVVRKGAPKPDISTATAFKKEVLSSQSLVYNEGSSGLYVEKLFEQLGVGEEAKTKTLRLPDAEAVMKHLASSRVEKEIGFGQLTAILLRADQGVALVGPLPNEIGNVTTYAAGVFAGARTRALAKQFIDFLVTPSAMDTFKATGVE